jgi:hypothetical protein
MIYGRRRSGVRSVGCFHVMSLLELDFTDATSPFETCFAVSEARAISRKTGANAVRT